MNADDIVSTPARLPASNIFVRAWRGEQSLPIVWWGFGLASRAIFGVLDSSWVLHNVFRNSAIAAIVVSCAALLTRIVWSVMVWRCAPNTVEKGWKWVVRGLVIAGWLGFALVVTRAIVSDMA
ncbi:MAG: hypothetical protein V4805_06625 [Pseudomonadota bacterium]